MTVNIDNQLTFFEDNSAAEIPADFPSVDPGPADMYSAALNSVQNEGPSELIKLVQKYQKRLWPNHKTMQNSAHRIERFDAHGDHRNLKISEITAVHIYDWLDFEKNRGLSDASINRYGSTISAVLTFATELKLRSDSVKLRYTKEYARERYMTDEEVERLIEHFTTNGEQWMADMVFVGVNTGMRLSEILALGVVNCGKQSFNHEAVILEDSVHLPAEITKTREGRWVSINKDVRAACLRLYDSIGEHFTHRKFYDRWNDARHVIAPGDKGFVFHCLRHTCASRMANDLQINSLIIAQQLGHKSISTTNKYVHTKPESQAAFARKMAVGSGNIYAAIQE